MRVKRVLVCIMLAAALVSSPAMAADYKFDIPGQHAFITFKANHLGYSYIVGGFNKFDGRFTHDAANPGASKTSVTIQAASIDTNHAERDKHLRGEEFLDVSKYPTISFTSTGYTAGADGDKLRGNLTLRGVSREVEIDVRQVGEGRDPWGGYRSGFVGHMRLNAADFGLPEWAGTIDVELNIEGVRI